MPDMTASGVDIMRGFTADSRKAAAYNALSKAYGPAIADDPTNAFNAAKVSAEIPLQPAAAQTAQDTAQANLTGKQLENTDTAGNQQRLAAYRATQMLKATAGPDGTIAPDAYDKIVRPNAALLGIDPAHVDQFGQMLAQPGGAQHLDTIAQSLIGPTKVAGAPIYGLDANGQPTTFNRDQYGNLHPAGPAGFTPVQQQRATQGQENANTNKAKLPILQQNANANTFRAGTQANNSVYGNPGGQTAPGGPAIAPAAGAAAANPNALFNKLPPKGKSQAISQANGIVNQASNLGTTNQILDTVMKQISPYTAGSGSLIKDLPGTAPADLKANLATLKAQGLMAFIQSVKAGGPGGTGGLRLSSEANAAMNLFGNMEQDQSAKQLAFHATLFKQAVNSLYQHANQSFKAMYGVAPHEALGADEPNTAGTPTLPGGWKYLGVTK